MPNPNTHVGFQSLEAYYQDIPLKILKETMKRLPNDIKQVVFEFYKEAGANYTIIAKRLLKLK